MRGEIFHHQLLIITRNGGSSQSLQPQRAGVGFMQSLVDRPHAAINQDEETFFL